jgi:hypothetical protein
MKNIPPSIGSNEAHYQPSNHSQRYKETNDERCQAATKFLVKRF